jgi:RNA recognition motif-containing protein
MWFAVEFKQIKFLKMNIYVGNLDYKVDEKLLEDTFREYGSVESVNIITDKYNGRSKGFGFVTMENKEEATKAISELNGKTLLSRDIVVNEARPKRDRY